MFDEDLECFFLGLFQFRNLFGEVEKERIVGVFGEFKDFLVEFVCFLA